ncbi:MAG: DUF5050 domain-containing protein [Sedimentibacter sp.]
MKKMTNGILKILLLSSMIFLFGASSNTSNAFATEVTVTLPTFNVRINNVEIDNKNREYPLIVYKDITYIPMTFHDSRFLGLETKWNESTGLKINKSESRHGYVDYNSTANKSRYTAVTPNFDVEVNGKSIDNSKEKYPLLVFRNVTYFPLTWRFAVDEFGWDYKFTQENGLEINNPINTGLKVTEVKLPLAGKRDFHNGAFTVAGDYIYFEGEKGIIYQAPIDNPSIQKAVYELPMWTYGDSYVYPSLETDESRNFGYGLAMLTYHQGGATMGTEYRIILNDDGTNETFAIGYLNRKVFGDTFGDITVDVSHFPPPFPNNLSMKKEGEEEFRAMGSADYVYGWVKNVGQSRSDDLYKIDNEIYVLAYKFNDEKATTGIHRVNIDTGETVRICDESVQKFVVDGNMIYFMDLGGYLYKISLVDGNKAEKITDFTVSNFTVSYNIVYYVTEEGKGLELFKLGESVSVNPGGRVRELVKTGGYVYCIFEDKAPYKLIVFDKVGLQIFKTNANIRFVSINQNRLFYHK